MTREAFIKVLDDKRYSYVMEGDKIVVTHKGSVYLVPLPSLPSGVEFRNWWSVYLGSRTSLPPGVVFRNGESVDLSGIAGGYFNRWNGNIKGIDSKRLLNKMIADGLFDRR